MICSLTAPTGQASTGSLGDLTPADEFFQALKLDSVATCASAFQKQYHRTVSHHQSQMNFYISMGPAYSQHALQHSLCLAKAKEDYLQVYESLRTRLPHSDVVNLLNMRAEGSKQQIVVDVVAAMSRVPALQRCLGSGPSSAERQPVAAHSGLKCHHCQAFGHIRPDCPDLPEGVGPTRGSQPRLPRTPYSRGS